LRAAFLAAAVLIPPIVGWSGAILTGYVAVHGNGPVIGLERGGDRPANSFRQGALAVARESAMQRFRGHSITDFDGGDVRREIGQPGVTQPLERGWWNCLLKVSQNSPPQQAGIDLNLCARVASTHAGSSVVFVRYVRTP